MMLSLASAFVAPYVIALLSFPLLARRGGTAWYVMAGLGVPIGLAPCLIPANCPLPRFVAAISAVVVAVKLVDVWLDARFRTAPNWRQFVAFLGNPFVHVRRSLAREPRPSRREDGRRLVQGLLGCAVGLALLQGLFAIDWERWLWAVEHVSKVLAFMAAIVSGLEAAVALWRLLGGAARDYMDNPIAARTPAEFWRRYNRNMQQFFWLNVFRPFGGVRAPVRTTLLVFALSAVMHEYVFAVAMGRVQGYQTAFFLLQGLAVALTGGFKPRGWRAIPAVVGTLAFNLATAVLFFASIHGIAPFYARGLPPWLPGR